MSQPESATPARLTKILEELRRINADESDAQILMLSRDATMTDENGDAIVLTSSDFWALFNAVPDARRAPREAPGDARKRFDAIMSTIPSEKCIHGTPFLPLDEFCEQCVGDGDENDPLFVLDFCEGAIGDAIGLEDGLDGQAGTGILRMIRNAKEWHRRAASARSEGPAGSQGEPSEARGEPTVREIQAVNAARSARWMAGSPGWTTLEIAGELAGEVGELANICKKLRRSEMGVPGNKVSDAELLVQAEGEVADVFIVLMLTASKLGIDLQDATREAFNKKSEQMGFPERIAGADHAN